nr:immunoglobulin light chain junction region [Macaca mulatta]
CAAWDEGLSGYIF